jgi:hypothetical protein
MTNGQGTVTDVFIDVYKDLVRPASDDGTEGENVAVRLDYRPANPPTHPKPKYRIRVSAPEPPLLSDEIRRVLAIVESDKYSPFCLVVEVNNSGLEIKEAWD